MENKILEYLNDRLNGIKNMSMISDEEDIEKFLLENIIEDIEDIINRERS